MTDELREKIIWQNINSSIEKGKILKGKIIAMETEKMKDEKIVCAIVDFKGIKVMIPATQMTKDGKNDKKILRNMMGAEISFIVVQADRLTSTAVASRIKAMNRLLEINFKKIEPGDKVYGKVVGIWKKSLRIEVLGIDFVMSPQDLNYGFIEDVSQQYIINEQIKVMITDVSNEKMKFKISVKELLEDPFINIRKEFSEKGEYLATITGYTENGIYANIKQGVDAVCLLPTWLDRPPFIGDQVIIRISKIVPEKRMVYSSLVKIVGSDANDRKT